MTTALIKVIGRPAARAVRFAMRVNHDSDLFLNCSFFSFLN